MGNPILKTLIQSFVDQSLLMLRVETLVLQQRNWKGSVFANFRYLQAISLHSSIWRRPIISHCEASQFFVVVENVEVSLSPESTSQFLPWKPVCMMKTQNHVHIAVKKHPTKSPVPTLSGKERSFGLSVAPHRSETPKFHGELHSFNM